MSYAQWELRYPNLLEDKITDVTFTSESTGFFVNEAGAIYRTKDGGKTWIEVFYDGSSKFTSIQFIDDQVGFAYAYIGSCFTYTTDGGSSWQQDDLNVHMALSVIGFSPSEFLKTDENGIYKTTSIFGKWEKIYELPLETVDGGDLFWEETIAIPVTTQQLSDSSLSVLYYNRHRSDYQNKNDSLYYLLTTDNRGANWDSTWINIEGKIASFVMQDEETGFFLTENGAFFRTDDSGKSWRRKGIPNTEVMPHKIVSFSKNRIYLKGKEVLKTTDGGDNWEIIQVPQNGFNTGYVISRNNHSAIRDLQLQINDTGEEWIHGKQYKRINGSSRLYFKNTTTGWAFHYRQDNTYKTDDGGFTWKIDDSFPESPTDIYYSDEQTGWIIGLNRIYKTEDSGENWTTLELLETDSIFDGRIFFEGKKGFIYAKYECLTGSCSVINVSINEGVSWVYNEIPFTVESMSVSEGNIFAVDNKKKLWMSSDKGASWEVSYDYSYENLVPEPLVRSAGEHVWLHVGFRNLAYSKDGGESWHVTAKVGHQLTKDMELIGPYNDGSAELFMVDDFGTIQKIDTDLGTYDKKYEIPPTRTHLRDITYTLDDEDVPHIWVKGFYNTILYRKGWGSVIVSNDKESTEIPYATTLHQNYPNPFNPSTTFSFDLDKAGHVKLSVFDITGRQVAIIQNNRLASGTHSMHFNAKRLASGIYIYKLETEDQVLSKKFTLVK